MSILKINNTEYKIIERFGSSHYSGEFLILEKNKSTYYIATVDPLYGDKRITEKDLDGPFNSLDDAKKEKHKY